MAASVGLRAAVFQEQIRFVDSRDPGGAAKVARIDESIVRSTPKVSVIDARDKLGRLCPFYGRKRIKASWVILHFEVQAVVFRQ
jgi:hypothetical protein